MKFWTFQVATPGVKQGPASQAAPQQPVIADKQAGHEPASPRSLQRSRYIEILLCAVLWFCSGSNVCCICCNLWILLWPIYWIYDLTADTERMQLNIFVTEDLPHLLYFRTTARIPFIEAKQNSCFCPVTLKLILQVIPCIVISEFGAFVSLCAVVGLNALTLWFA